MFSSMLNTVFVTKISKFLPNNPVYNDEMEEYLGLIKGLKSKSKALILRNNGIKCRYYALNKEGKSTHTNAEITAEAIKNLVDSSFSLQDIELLACGTASPDFMMPPHASIVHGLLGNNSIDAMTGVGSCNSSMWALNYAWMSLLIGKYKNAVCTGSEKTSSWMLAKNFEEESKYLESLGKNPYIAFEREFLRWMLSDGAGAVLLENKPNKDNISLRIDWIEVRSYANQAETCMFAGGYKNENNELIPWRDLDLNQWLTDSIFSVQQDSRLLEQHITYFASIMLKELTTKHNIDFERLNYFLPHMSSEFFRLKIKTSFAEQGIHIADEKWFTNLHKVGNVGSASGYMMLEELFYSGNLKTGNKILLFIPESARFSYTLAHLTVV